LQNQSTLDNRKTLIEDHQKMRTTTRELARLEKQKRLAENLREKINAEEAGDDVQRKKNWNYSIEQNDKWEERLRKIEEKETWEFNGEC
jgi:pre-mRNA-splicing factor SYF2